MGVCFCISKTWNVNSWSSAWLSHGSQAHDRSIRVYSLVDTVLSMPRPADSLQRWVSEWSLLFPRYHRKGPENPKLEKSKRELIISISLPPSFPLPPFFSPPPSFSYSLSHPPSVLPSPRFSFSFPSAQLCTIGCLVSFSSHPCSSDNSPMSEHHFRACEFFSAPVCVFLQLQVVISSSPELQWPARILVFSVPAELAARKGRYINASLTLALLCLWAMASPCFYKSQIVGPHEVLVWGPV